MLELLFALVIKEAPNYCTNQQPYPDYNNVCNGYQQQCWLSFSNCSTVKGQPGTWNPGGYTPCQNQYGCSSRSRR